MRVSIFFLVVIGFFCSILSGQSPHIYCNFPGGNIRVDSIVADTAYLSPDQRDTRGTWFYWCFAVRHTAGRSITFKFPPRVIGSCGPAISFDSGWTWRYTDTVHRSKPMDSFTHVFTTADEVRFSVGMPYTQRNFDLFSQQYLAMKKNIDVDVLCITPQKREIKIYTIHPAQDVKYKLFFTARQHSCEMMASYVLEGMIDYFLTYSSDLIRDSAEIKFIPFVDADGVEAGDQGKNRIPRDHNRDYSGSSIYCSTAAIRELLPAWSDNKLVVGIDLHCPGLLGWSSEQIYFYGSENKISEAEELNLTDLVMRYQQGELKMKREAFYIFGSPNNKGIDYKQGMGLRYFMQTIPGIRIATTLEFPYAVVDGKIVTQNNARQFGYDLGCAIDMYLQGLSIRSGHD